MEILLFLLLRLLEIRLILWGLVVAVVGVIVGPEMGLIGARRRKKGRLGEGRESIYLRL